MHLSSIRKTLAWIALAALTACGGGPNGSPALPAASAGSHAGTRPAGSHLLQTIVGVGDSLTAGYQSNGFLGQANMKDPLEAGVIVPPTQENGWWALLVEQASGLPIPTAVAHMYDPAVSPLPLIREPGLNNQLVPVAGAPFGNSKVGDTCSGYHGFNAAGYLLGGLDQVRMNPKSTTVRNVGVPGITLHEANVLTEPQTNTCQQLPGIPGLLNEAIADESSTFWPVLGNFAHMGPRLSEVNAAASLHPTLATVWLGANDVLKYMGSGGLFVGGDNTVGQVEQDLSQTIYTLIYSGAKVVVADLPNVLETAYFQRATIPGNAAKDCNVAVTYYLCTVLDVAGFVITPTQAHDLASQLATTYHLDTPGGCKPTSTTKPCGYLTLAGGLGALEYYLSKSKIPNLDCSGPNFTAPCEPGSGLGGYYITPAFAAKVQALNSTVNEGIDEAAFKTSVPLVPISKIFDGLASGDPSNPYFHTAATVKPGTCCVLSWGGGLLSNDSIHPSNTGYALIAYFFIDTINRVYHQHIRQIDYKAVYNGTRCSVENYCYPDPYAPPYSSFPHVIRR